MADVYLTNASFHLLNLLRSVLIGQGCHVTPGGGRGSDMGRNRGRPTLNTLN